MAWQMARKLVNCAQLAGQNDKIRPLHQHSKTWHKPACRPCAKSGVPAPGSVPLRQLAQVGASTRGAPPQIVRPRALVAPPAAPRGLPAPQLAQSAPPLAPPSTSSAVTRQVI
jgi:hypothetical protein